jgi:hypothetical protein
MKVPDGALVSSATGLREESMTKKPVEPAKARVVTIIAPSEFEARIEQFLRRTGATGYTVAIVSGHGAHGGRTPGVLDAGNVRIETIVSTEIASHVLEHVVQFYGDLDVIAFAADVDAVPAGHFNKVAAPKP